MAKAATKKSSNPSKVTKSKKAPAAKSSRATAAKPAKATKPPAARKSVTKASIPAKKPRAARAPIVSKDELRDQIEKLTAAITALKTKGRETAKMLRAAEARIEVLEHQISQTEARAVTEGKVKSSRKIHTPTTVSQPLPEAEGVEELEEPADLETA